MRTVLTRRNFSFAVVGVTVAALAFLLLYGLRRDASLHPLGSLPIAKRSAPDFTLRPFDVYGVDSISKADLLGQPVVLNFWASWCPACREGAPMLEQVWREYKDRGVRFLGVSVQDSESDALAYIDRFDITFPNAPESGDITLDFGMLGHPETFFIDREGMIVGKFVGPVKVAQLRGFVEEILGEPTGRGPTVDR